MDTDAVCGADFYLESFAQPPDKIDIDKMNPAGGWIPDQRLNLEQAIPGYTMGDAVAAGKEKTEGSIEAGKLADLIILSQDLFKVDPNQIGNTKVLMTMVGGKVVCRDPSWEINSSD